jgi:ABC-2 type transport system permease protein
LSARSFRAAVAEVLRIGFKEAVAYRAELLVWVLATTMPLVMLALFAAVARDAPVGRYGEIDFVAYFLATFLVRQLTGSWAAWQINMEVREGTLATRLLRPIHPLLVYGLEGLASIPLRLVLAVPVAAAALVMFAGDRLSRDPAAWAIWTASILGAWLITLFINFAIGCLALFVDSSGRVMDVYLAIYFVASGYLIPVDLFPPGARAVLEVLPFRYQISLPVELMTSRFDGRVASAARELAFQWAWVALMLGVVVLVWRRGIKRFGAFGG